VAVALLLATARAAEPAPSLIGATRDQVLTRLGEPKSQITAGNREIMFFAQQRVVLRNGVVVEVEALPAETPPKRPPATPTPSDAPAPKESTTERSSGTQPSTSSTVPSTAPTTTTPSETATTAATPATTAPAAPEPKLEIKSVRPPSASGARPAPKQEVAPAAPTKTTPAAPSATDITTTKSAPSAPTTAPAAPPRPAATVTPKAETPTTVPATSHTTVTEPTPKAEETAKTEETTPAAAPAPIEKKTKTAPAARRPAREVETPSATEQIFTARTYIFTFIIIAGGVGYLIWRFRQRQLLLAATSVSRTPFAAAPVAGGGAMFTPELLAKLEWKRFEDLVAAYYSKTGVVAARTKSGPSSPVNIRISWKGEPRPFACVRCIANPAGLIDAKPLQDLHAVLAAEDIRRGYVVTSGKFGVPARDFAEEKHLTLLPGDIFLEKLNALPEAARAEIMREVATGDYTTPSCPKCEAKMIRSPEDPSMWRCAAHPEQQIPVRK
jgi:hypothetical protein